MNKEKYHTLIFYGLFTASFVCVLLAMVLTSLAYWPDIPNVGRVALLSLPVIGAHTAGFVLRKLDRAQWMSAVAHLVGTLCFGGAMLLLARNYLLLQQDCQIFMLLTAMAFLIFLIADSILHGLLALVLIPFWLNFDAYYSIPPYIYIYLLAVVPVVIFVTYLIQSWRLRSMLLLLGVLGICVYSLIFIAQCLLYHVPIPLFILYLVPMVFYAISALLPDEKRFPPAHKTLRFLGTISLLACLLISSFPDVLKQDILQISGSCVGYRFGSYQESSPFAIPIMLLLGSVILVIIAGIFVPLIRDPLKEVRSHDFWLNRMFTVILFCSFIAFVFAMAISKPSVKDLTPYAVVFAVLLGLNVLIRFWLSSSRMKKIVVGLAVLVLGVVALLALANGVEINCNLLALIFLGIAMILTVATLIWRWKMLEETNP